jgi:cytochrome c-type biogenesis protein
VELGFVTLALAALAGTLTMLNPCVLPLVPMVIGAATTESRAGLFALALGMSITFAVAGTALAATGQLLGVDGDALRLVIGVLMIAIGVLLLSSRAQLAFARRTSGVANVGSQALARFSPAGPAGQFGVGALLGLVWTPCVGPTLGAAIALAAQGEGLGQVGIVMGVFSAFAVMPLIAIGMVSRAGFVRSRDRALRIGAAGRKWMGWGLLVIGLLILSGGDKWLEAVVLDHMPDWLLDLTTRF